MIIDQQEKSRMKTTEITLFRRTLGHALLDMKLK